MGAVQILLPGDLGDAVTQQVAAGRASSADDYVAHAVREYLAAEHELAAEAQAGVDDIDAGRFHVVDDLAAWGKRNLERAR